MSGSNESRRARDPHEQRADLPGNPDVPYLPAAPASDRADKAKGFQLRRLILLGVNVPAAELRFTPGLNVVSGPSNTGKSFAFTCLDFMLGAQSLAKRVAEAKPYDEAVLEIESRVGEWFTLRRSLNGGRFRWYDVSFDEIGQWATNASLSEKHSAKSADNASAQFLALSGLLNRTILTSRAQGKTRPLSFRDLAKLLLIDEQQIITTESPVTGPNPILHTAEESLFELLLTGRDAEGIVALTDVTESRQRLLAQADMLDGMIAEMKATDDGGLDPAEVERRKAILAEQIRALVEQSEAASTEVDAAIAAMNEVSSSILPAKSRLVVVDELLARFALLRRSYETDLDRLDLVRLGGELLAQLPEVSCPVCGQPMGVMPHPIHSEEDTSIGSFEVQIASSAEATKIRGHLEDLRGSVSELSEERAGLIDSIRARERELEVARQRLNEQLRPRVAEIGRALRAAIDAQQQLTRHEAKIGQRTGLLERRYEIELSLRRFDEMPSKAVVGPGEFSTEALSHLVRRLLRSWNYPDPGTVVFDRGGMDFILGGRPRRDEGKGVRAILYSAFVVALMRLCRQEGRPHPGFIVLDSPLTTYRGPDSTARASSEDQLPVGVEEGFFWGLASTLGRGADADQVIVFDNKEPPPAADGNFVRFTRLKGVGRYGFIAGD